MTDAGAGPDNREINEHLQTWTDALCQTLGEIAGVPFPCALVAEAPAGMPPAGENDLWVVVGVSGSLRGEMSLRVPPATVVRLAQALMNEPPAPAEATSEHREAALELLRQVGGLAASALKRQWGELQLRLDAADSTPSWPASTTAWLRAGEGEAAVLIEARLSAALAASLRTEKSSVEGVPAAPVAAPGTAPASDRRPHDETVNLDLLMDVQLEVTLCFGSRTLLLREILDLNPGSVIDLDRTVQEPVDMLLDGRVVARGEVVVVGGNYGLRVTQVAPAGA